MIQAISSVVAIAAFLAFVPAAIISARSLQQVLGYLRQSYPDLWFRLGAPTMLGRQWSTSSPAAKFIYRREYESLGDQELSVLCHRSRIASNVCVSLFFVMLFSFLVLSVNK